MTRRIVSAVLSLTLLFSQTGLVQAAGELNMAAYLGRMTYNPVDKLRLPHLRYFSYDTLNNNFGIILDKGDFKEMKGPKLQDSARELLKYFLIGVTLPDESFWVNLRPDSEDNIIDGWLAQTEIGKIFLETDLQLKKDTAQFTSPQTAEGKEYWDKLYQKAGELFGSDAITIPTLTRPWIVPGEVIIREAGDSAYIYKATLKVMLEQDHLKDSAVYNFTDPRLKALNEYSSQLIRELIIPKLTKEINISKRYAPLRQVYYSLILARWFKSRFLGKGGIYSWAINKRNLDGLTSNGRWSKTDYFKEYQKSFQKGQYNLQVSYGSNIRSYFSGGIDMKASSPMEGFAVTRKMADFAGRLSERDRNVAMYGIADLTNPSPRLREGFTAASPVVSSPVGLVDRWGVMPGGLIGRMKGSGRDWYLAINSSTQSATFTVIDAGTREIIWQWQEKYDDEAYRTFNAPKGSLPDADKNRHHTDPLMLAAALDKGMRELGEAFTVYGWDIHNIKAISGAGQQHGTVYYNNRAESVLSRLDPSKPLAGQLEGILARRTAPIWRDKTTETQAREAENFFGGPEQLRQLTGSAAELRFGLSQFMKFAQDNPGAWAETATIVNIAGFNGSLLTGIARFPFDPGDGSGTNAMGIRGDEWLPQLDELVPGLRAKLPEIKPTDYVVGRISPYWEKYGFSPDTKIVNWTGDNPAAMIGQGILGKGQVGLSLGTSFTLYTLVDEGDLDATLRSRIGNVFRTPSGKWMKLVCFQNGALALEEARNGLITEAEAIDRLGKTREEFASQDAWDKAVDQARWDIFNEEVNRTAVGNNGAMMITQNTQEEVVRIPYVAGRPFTRNMDWATAGRPEKLRAAVEGQMYFLKWVADQIGLTFTEINLTGGAARNPLIRQIIADIFNARVNVLQKSNFPNEPVSLGSAINAAKAVKGEAFSWQDAIRGLVALDSGMATLPKMENVAQYEKYRSDFDTLVRSAAAAASSPVQATVTSKPWGEVDKQEVGLYTLTNTNGAAVEISNFGGTVVSIKVPDRNGRLIDVVLGHENFAPYVGRDKNPYFGSIIGRYGNRIAEGAFTLDGVTYQLAKNNGPNHLHGGNKGFDQYVWNAEPVETAEGTGVRLTRVSPDGEEGYPGNLKVTVTYTWTNQNELKIEYAAATDKATPVALTNHLYFNLGGEGDILGTNVMINADRFTPVKDSGAITTGEIRAVEGTPLDFRAPHAIGERIDGNDKQLEYGFGYDHNFVVNGTPGQLRLAARASEPGNGITMEVLTTEPSVQLYTGNFLDGSVVGKNSQRYVRRSGFCLETQSAPDSPNKEGREGWPSAILRPGQEYKSTTIYRFGVADASQASKPTQSDMPFDFLPTMGDEDRGAYSHYRVKVLTPKSGRTVLLPFLMALQSAALKVRNSLAHLKDGETSKEDILVGTTPGNTRIVLHYSATRRGEDIAWEGSLISQKTVRKRVEEDHFADIELRRTSAASSPMEVDVTQKRLRDSPLRGQSLSPMGGIDFRSIPLIIQPIGNFSKINFSPPSSGLALQRLNPEEELKAISSMVARGIVPSGERVKELIFACCYKKELSSRLDDLIACLTDICRLQEEYVEESGPELKESLMLVEAAAASMAPEATGIPETDEE
jgi:aldose 1-epimerase